MIIINLDVSSKTHFSIWNYNAKIYLILHKRQRNDQEEPTLTLSNSCKTSSGINLLDMNWDQAVNVFERVGDKEMWEQRSASVC